MGWFPARRGAGGGDLNSRLIWLSRAGQRHTGGVRRRPNGHLAKRPEPGADLL
jgi:hypothetical protein